VSLVENGTHVLFGTRMSAYGTGEITVAKTVLPGLQKGMLCLADRQFFRFTSWQQALSTGADMLWRIKKNLRLPCEKRLADGSYLSRIYPSEKDWRHKTNGVVVRVIDYRLEGVADSEPIYRLATSILEAEQAPAQQLAAFYHERWEIETALDELKTHLRGARIVLRSKNTGLGPAGVLRAFAGSLRYPRAHARSRPQRGRRPGPPLFPACGARHSPQTPHLSRRSPLSTEWPFMTAYSMKFCRSGSSPAATDATRAASSAR